MRNLIRIFLILYSFEALANVSVSEWEYSKKVRNPRFLNYKGENCVPMDAANEEVRRLSRIIARLQKEKAKLEYMLIDVRMAEAEKADVNGIGGE